MTEQSLKDISNEVDSINSRIQQHKHLLESLERLDNDKQHKWFGVIIRTQNGDLYLDNGYFMYEFKLWLKLKQSDFDHIIEREGKLKSNILNHIKIASGE